MKTSEPASAPMHWLLGPIQLALASEKARGWLVYDLRGRNLVASRLLGFADPAVEPRALVPEHRFFYWIPVEGLPVAIAHVDDLAALPDLPGDRVTYETAYALRAELERVLPRQGTLLVEQGPFAQLADLAVVDEATLALLRGRDATIRSSLELANRFAGPLGPDERGALTETIAALEQLGGDLADGIEAGSWGEVFRRVELAARRAGLELAPESGLAIGADSTQQRALARSGRFEPARAREARLDLWVHRHDRVGPLVPWSLALALDAPSERQVALVASLEEAERAFVDAITTPPAKGAPLRRLGTEAAEIAYDALRQRRLSRIASCIGWALSDVPRGTHAATLDAEGVADPRELVVGTVWGVRLGAKLDGLGAMRVGWLERTERAFRWLGASPTGVVSVRAR